MVSRLVMAAFVALGLASPALASGKLALIGDEWLLSNDAFANNQEEAEDLVDALDAFLGSSLYAVYSSNFGYGTSLNDYINNKPGSDSITDIGAIGLIGAYETIFLGGALGRADNPGNLSIWENYLAAGGNLVILLGTAQPGGGSAGEAAAWNPLTSQYGLTAGSTWFDDGTVVTKQVSSGSFLPGVSSFYWGFGQSVSASGNAQIALASDFSYGRNTGVVGIVDTAPIPLPASVLMLGAGLATLGAGGMLRKRRAAA